MAKPLPVGATLIMLAALAFADGARAAAPAQYEHDAAGRRVALKLPNGVNTTYAHDAAGRLTKVESKNVAGNVISAFGYTLDATGNRTAMDVTLNGTVNHIAYEFDNAYRLTRETRKDAAGNVLYDEGFTYDPVGNRLTRNRTQQINGELVTENTNYAYNNANQLLTETTNGVTTAYGYDKNGNNTTISTPAANGAPAKTIAMTYDWLNRQTRWSDGTRTESTVFAGADWKRASTTVTMGANGPTAPPSIVKYLYDGDNVLADFGNDNALTAFYVTPGLDQNLSITDVFGQTAYYTQDGLGSVRLLTSANGAIINRYDYTAFGEPFAPNTSTTVSNRYTYTAREQSPLAAHGAPMYYRWRNYAPKVGRFMWRDPIGYEGGVNVYGYVAGSPALHSDPSGLIRYEINDSECVITMKYVVKMFWDINEDEKVRVSDPNNPSQMIFRSIRTHDWTQPEKKLFRSLLKSQIEYFFNNSHHFRIKPQKLTYTTGYWWWKDCHACPCYSNGFVPKVEIVLLPDDDETSSEDWTVTAIKSISPYRSNNARWKPLSLIQIFNSANIWQKDVWWTTKVGGSPQVGAVHEFGHSIGLMHPGYKVRGENGKIYEKNRRDEYRHQGLDINGNYVHGQNDLMGSGWTMRGFYFQIWADELNSKYPQCGYQARFK